MFYIIAARSGPTYQDGFDGKVIKPTNNTTRPAVSKHIFVTDKNTYPKTL
jgi:hypothetical protein